MEAGPAGGAHDLFAAKRRCNMEGHIHKWPCPCCANRGMHSKHSPAARLCGGRSYRCNLEFDYYRVCRTSLSNWGCHMHMRAEHLASC